MIRTLLADDHHIVVEGLREILNTMDNISVVGVANNGIELLRLAQSIPAELAILDINMPEMDGLACARKLKSAFPKMKILFLTMYHDRSFLNEMISAGADGCVLKTGGTTELREAIQRLVNDKSYFDSLADFKKEDEKLTVPLSTREIEIIKLVAAGQSSTQIAEQLFISEHTVKTHRKNIFKKLGINHVSQLTTIAVNRGWC